MDMDDDHMVSGSSQLLTQEELQEAIAAPSLKGGLTPDAARLFRVYRTISNMLEKRGYMVPKAMRELTPAEYVFFAFFHLFFWFGRLLTLALVSRNDLVSNRFATR
jgi:RNA polymerase Rpb5, N-terminal domain